MRRTEWFALWMEFIVCTGLIIFTPPVLKERPYFEAIFNLLMSMSLLSLGFLISRQRCWDGSGRCKEINIITKFEVEQATRHLRLEAVIRELEKNAGCYDGEE